MKSLLQAVPQYLERLEKLAKANLVPVFISNSLFNIQKYLSHYPNVIIFKLTQF